MNNRFKIRFSLISSGKGSEEKQIFIVCTIFNKEIFYYSGYRVHPSNFIKEKKNISGDVVYIQQVKKNTFNKLPFALITPNVGKGFDNRPKISASV